MSSASQHYFGDSIDITDVFQDCESLVEFLISSGHLPPPPAHIGNAWRVRHDNNNNKIVTCTRSSAIAGRPCDAKACQGFLKWTWKWQP